MQCNARIGSDSHQLRWVSPISFQNFITMLQTQCKALHHYVNWALHMLYNLEHGIECKTMIVLSKNTHEELMWKITHSVEQQEYIVTHKVFRLYDMYTSLPSYIISTISVSCKTEVYSYYKLCTRHYQHSEIVQKELFPYQTSSTILVRKIYNYWIH